MRKHHKRWVALFSAAAISTTGLMGVSGTAVADDKESRSLNWPLITQGVSTYSLDGYEIGYLPPGLERYGISASSATDRQGNRQSQISWTQGPDQLYGRVAVVRSEAFQELDDLRQSRYGHLPTGELERLEPNETFTGGAFLSEESGDLFWLEEPGVAVTTHLQPDRWGGNELVKFATSVEAAEVEDEVEGAAEAENAGADAEDTAEVEPVANPPEAEEPEEEAPAEEAPEEEAPGEEAPEEEEPEAEAPAEEAPTEEAPAEEAPAEEAPTEEAPAEEAPEEEEPEAEAPAEEAPEEEAPAEEEPEAEAPAEEAPAEEAPTEEAPAEESVEDTRSRQVKECLIDQFVDFGSGETVLDTESLTPDSGAFVEQALSKGDLDDAERDRLLATVWYYGDEEQKNSATTECARANDIDTAAVEGVLDDVADEIAALVQEAEDAMTEGMDQVSQTGQDGELPEEGEIDPVDDEEWQELWESLPWSFPTEADTSGS
ncbi:hypothetical protein [Nocardiopsis sp. NRRL B-16309]|uniref:hypothetical protein n=1 Tax=Nocardiopsis sp. NRRL B-16309 TaxID=1519494 RepID=UPI0006AF2092|nr:hypothetical protein [Nocardiopsis sp. NRRL B-16309]KOX24175.1 hypothetical protein ADL05_00975 [Nocardiopsis sp. NRRL B-16309]